MKFLPLLPAALALFSSLLIAAPVGADEHRCKHVHTRGFGHDNGDGTTSAMLGAGLFFGTSQASFTVVDVQSGVATLAGEVVVTTFFGNLEVPITGSFDLVSGAFEASGAVAKGTGLLAGATGHLTFEGTEDFSDGSFVEEISGELCAHGGC